MTVATQATTHKGWRSRIVGSGEEAPDQLLANPANWRIHPKPQQDALNDVLDDVGWIQQVVVNQQSGHLIDGHLRVSLAMRNHEATVPVLYVDLDDREEALALATLDPIAAMAAADKSKLDELLREVDTGSAAIQAMLAGLAEDAGLDYGKPDAAEDPGAQVDKAEELRAKWGTERGQLWEIPSATCQGAIHRLMCGDSTNLEDVGRLTGDVTRVALLATDPPYNVGIAYGESVDDQKGEDEYRTFTESWFGLWRQVSVRQIVAPGCYNLARWLRWFEPYHVAPWTKTNAMTNGKIARWWCWEPLLFFGDGWKRTRANDVFDFPVPPQKAEGMGSLTPYHPCPKPVPMWADLIANYTEPGEFVVDAFDGSGTTIVAAEQTGRRASCMELEPKYVAVALERLAGMGLQPRLT